MAAAFLHSRLNVPDDVTAWRSNQLPESADGRMVGDCGVMSRAVAHMLSGVDGLQARYIASPGHARLLVTTADGRGFVQSNQAIVTLAGIGSDYAARAKQTIDRRSRLQVLHSMPAPIALGTPFAPGLDPDAAFDASTSAAAAAIAGLTGTAAQLRDSGPAVRSVLARFDVFAQRADALYKEWQSATPEARSRLESRRKDLAAEYAALRLKAERLPQSPATMGSFLRKQLSDGALNYSDGYRWLQTGTLPMVMSGGGLFVT